MTGDMKHHFTLLLRDGGIGTAGTIGSLTLVEWNAVIGILVGIATLVYMSIRIVQALHRGPADDSRFRGLGK